MRGHIFTISEINGYIKAVMENDPRLSTVYVRGEISNYKYHSSGHQYMTLKDEGAVLRAVMFKFDGVKLKFRPENGMKIIAKGRISVFPRDGQYQLYITDMIPDGMGALSVAFEQLKKKLSAEGLFDTAHKKIIPEYPERIALVTSPTGAAVRDMLRILKARYPIAKVMVCPVLVQGPEAPADICRAIEFLNEHSLCDVIICGRGGGSLEDLWAFNDEGVARAIYASEIPVISAVGHEPDVTIADFVADLRAATPSNAAELAVPDQIALRSMAEDRRVRAVRAMSAKLALYRERLDKAAERPSLTSPLRYFQDKRMLLEFTAEKLNSLMGSSLSAKRERFARLSGERLESLVKQSVAKKREGFVRLAASLDAMSPLKVLSRGYSITTDAEGHVLRSAEETAPGARVSVRLMQGKLDCVVEKRG